MIRHSFLSLWLHGVFNRLSPPFSLKIIKKTALEMLTAISGWDGNLFYEHRSVVLISAMNLINSGKNWITG